MVHQADDRFNVVQFFVDDNYEFVRRNVSAAEAVATTQHYTTSVAAQMGITVRVIITDMMDQTVFEWAYGKIVFPTQKNIDEVLDSIEKAQYESHEEDRAESIREAKFTKENK